MKRGYKRMRIVCVFFFSLLVSLLLSSCRSSDVLTEIYESELNQNEIVRLTSEPVVSKDESEVIDNENLETIKESEFNNDNNNENKILDIEETEFEEEPIEETEEVMPITESVEKTIEIDDSPVLIEYTYLDEDKMVYTTLNLNVRSGPSTDFGVIGTVSVNSEIKVTGICNETGWYRIDYNGSDGFCDSNYTVDNIVTITADDNSVNNTKEGSVNDNAIVDNNTVASDGIVSSGDSGASSYYVGLVQDAFNSLPQWVQNSFINNGWHVYVRSGSWWYDYGWSMQLKGLTHYVNHAIYISSRDDSANYHTLAHEMGHYVDWINGQPSNFSEFSNIYNFEYSQFCNYYSYSNGYPGVEELFAEGIYHYWTDPGTLANVAPQTYNYIKNVLG